MIGKHPRQAHNTDKERLADALEGMISSAIAVIPEDSSVEIKDAAGKSASTDAFEKFLNFCKAEINIALLGQNQTTEQESNRASAQVGLEVMEDIRSDDQAMIEATFNTLLQWIVKYNFNVEQLPKFEFYEQEAINTDQVERDSKLHAMGVRFPKPTLSVNMALRRVILRCKRSKKRKNLQIPQNLAKDNAEPKCQCLCQFWNS